MFILFTCIFVLIIALIFIIITDGRVKQIWAERKSKKLAVSDTQKKKELDQISYPKHLRTDEEIQLYIQKNYRSFPNREEWGVLLIDMIREMTMAGWNTEIPMYVKYKYGAYQTNVTVGNQELSMIFYSIIHKYEEIFDTRNLN